MEVLWRWGGGRGGRGDVPARPEAPVPGTVGSGTLEPARPAPGAPALPRQQRTKAGVHVSTVTQQLSRLQPWRRRLARPGARLPPKHEFYFQVQSRAAGWGRGRAGRAAGGSWPLSSPFLPPSPCRWAAVPRPRRSPRVRRAQRSRPRAGREGRFGGPGVWGRRVLGLPRSPPRGEANRPAPFRAPPAAGAVAAAERQEGGRGEGRPASPRPRSRPPPAWTPLARKPRRRVLAAQLARTWHPSLGTPEGTRGGLAPLPPAQEPVAKGRVADLGLEAALPLQAAHLPSVPTLASQPPFNSGAPGAGGPLASVWAGGPHGSHRRPIWVSRARPPNGL